MPKSKSSAKAQPSALPEEGAEIHSNPEESASSDQESDPEVSIHTIQLQVPSLFQPTMYMPTLKDPTWTGQ